MRSGDGPGPRAPHGSAVSALHRLGLVLRRHVGAPLADTALGAAAGIALRAERADEQDQPAAERRASPRPRNVTSVASSPARRSRVLSLIGPPRKRASGRRRGDSDPRFHHHGNATPEPVRRYKWRASEWLRLACESADAPGANPAYDSPRLGARWRRESRFRQGRMSGRDGATAPDRRRGRAQERCRIRCPSKQRRRWRPGAARRPSRMSPGGGTHRWHRPSHPRATSRTADARTGAKLFFKAENLQRGGAFKFRGAYNAISALPEAVRARGVLSFSSGNHAQAIALASQLLGIPATSSCGRRTGGQDRRDKRLRRRGRAVRPLHPGSRGAGPRARRAQGHDADPAVQPPRT